METNLENRPKVFVVMNPVAGQSEAPVVQELIESRLRGEGVVYEIYHTNAQENVRGVVEAAIARGFSLVLAAGGDGTVSAAASALVDKDVCLGILPSGTWNALARNLDIPLNVPQALDIIFGDHGTRTIDVLQVDNNFYVLNVSVGVGSVIMRKVQREDIRRLGRFSFIIKGFMELLGFPPPRFTVSVDGGPPASFRASELIVANSGVVGMKMIRLDPGIHMDDGRLNVCRIYTNNLLDYAVLGFNMLMGAQRKDPRVVCWEVTREVQVRASKRLPVQADGELIGNLPVTVKLRSKALQVIIPPPAL